MIPKTASPTLLFPALAPLYALTAPVAQLWLRVISGIALIILLATVYFHWIILEQGYRGAELSLIWSAVTLTFVTRGGGRYSLDRLIKKEL